MVDLSEKGALTERFGFTKPDYRVHAEITAAKSREQHEDDLAGQKSGNKENMILASAAASIDAKDAKSAKAEQDAKQQYDDILFAALLNAGDLDNYVAENTFAGMTAVEIADVVSQIEAETGQSFEDYAKNILGEGMPERGANESEADYHRRVLTAVADEVLNDDLSFKAGYENDPVARIVRRSEVYRDALEFVEGVNNNLSAVATQAVADKAAEGYAVSDVMSAALDSDELAGLSRDAQNEMRDASPKSNDDNTASFGAAFGLNR